MSRSISMASARTVCLLLLPAPVSVLLCMAVLCLCRVAARKLTALARAHYCPPPLKEQQHRHHAIRGLPPVARYRRKQQQQVPSRSSCVVVAIGEEEHCVFCLSGIEEGEEIRELKCRHLFHRGCLDRWLLLATRPPTCPLCRGRLLAPPVSAVWAPWEVMMGDGEEVPVEEEEEDSDMMLFMACVHSRSSWLWPSS